MSIFLGTRRHRLSQPAGEWSTTRDNEAESTRTDSHESIVRGARSGRKATQAGRPKRQNRYNPCRTVVLAGWTGADLRAGSRASRAVADTGESTWISGTFVRQNPGRQQVCQRE